MKNPSVYEIVKTYLQENGFDGLYNSELECGCPISNLNPCGDMKNDCTAGYEVKAPPGDDCDYYICDSKDDKPWEE